MRLPETSKIHVSFHHEQNVKKSKTDVTDMLNFLDYFTVNVVNVKKHTSLFFKKEIVKTETVDFILLLSLFSSLCT